VDRRRPILRDLEEVGAEQADRVRREIELVDQQHVRPVALDHLGDVAGLAPEDVVHLGMRKVVD
jgi:hypothetical protein